MVDFLVRCESCGYDISSSDTLELAKMNAERIIACSQCHSKSFEIEKREKSVSISDGAKDGDYDGDDDPGGQSSLDNF